MFCFENGIGYYTFFMIKLIDSSNCEYCWKILMFAEWIIDLFMY